MNKFEQLIEYVINDEEAKARELFHELVVEKSRAIYEEMMAEEEFEIDEAADEELDESEDDIDESLDEMGGDAADDLIDDIEVEEEGVSMEGDDMEGDDMEGDDMEGDDDSEELEDRVVDLEDKLDDLMSEFESLMSDDAGMDAEDDMGMDVEDDMDSMDVDTDMDMGAEDDTKMSMEEAVNLKSVSVPVKSEEGNINKKSVVAANAGAKGAMAKPVHATGTEAQGRPAPSTKELVGKVGNTPAQSTQKPTPATKPNLSQATGVNTRSVVK